MKWFGVVLGLAVVLSGCQLRPVAAELPAKAGRLAFMSNRNGPNFEIYVMDRDGGNVTQLTSESGGNNLLPVWSGPAKAFVYLAEQADGTLALFRMEGNGNDPHAISGDLAVDPAPVAWSPTGQWVGFGAGRETNPEVYAVSAEGDQVVNLSNHPAEDIFSGWSPDGTQVLFMSDRDTNLVIYRADVSGGEPQAITDPAYNSGRPSWSPDGSKIAFMSNQDGDVELYTLDTQTDALTRLTESPGFDGYPAWSPDGSKIVFLSGRDQNAEIYVMDADGGNPTNLTNTPDIDESVQGDFSWSPDGEQISYHLINGDNVEIYVMDADGGNPTNLSNNPAVDFAAAWTR